VNSSRPLVVTVSVGVSFIESQVDTPETLIKRADLALYRAKREGRNRVILDAA
jgi:two-component system cell cycle response regulator